MSRDNCFDFLIVGQGLAGSLLAWELITRNEKVLVIDNGLENASLCAAGLINPITGMRFVKSFQVERFLPIAKNYYQQLGCFFQQHFYIEKNMARIFGSEKELKNAQKRLQDSAYQSYLGKIAQTTEFQAPQGFVEQKQTAYVLTQPLLNSLKQFFIQTECYQQQQFDYAGVSLLPKLNWCGINAKKIIFCEGFRVQDNPWFSTLPLQPSKGEILTLKTEKALPDKILNYGHWLIPLEKQVCRTGATFDTQQLDTFCTDTAKEVLLNSLKQILPDSGIVTVQKHQANIRPTTLDKQPFIGLHPCYPQLGIFNGFGTKGSLQIPYYCQHFADYLLKNTTLDPAVDIGRYFLTSSFF